MPVRMSTSIDSLLSITGRLGNQSQVKRASHTKSGHDTLTNIELHGFLRSRRSIRRFRKKAVDSEVLNRILTTAIHAPSAHNRQPWRFAVLTSPEAKSRLAETLSAEFARDLTADGLTKDEVSIRLNRSKSRINESPAAVVLCTDTSEMDVYPDEKRRHAELTMALQSTALAGQQLLLAAHAEGLGAVWTCGPLFAPDTVRKTLELPPSWQPQAMVLIGYPAEEPNEKTIKPIEEIAKYF
jgi:coenzyme F420-0:L-glutamate ligase/coenzyme F420-1:gamma-L-glutamate ligase